jgi:hypothetical protein
MLYSFHHSHKHQHKCEWASYPGPLHAGLSSLRQVHHLQHAAQVSTFECQMSAFEFSSSGLENGVIAGELSQRNYVNCFQPTILICNSKQNQFT